MDSQPTSSDIPCEFLSPLEFSLHSGLSIPTVRRYVKSGKLPAHQPNGRGSRILIPTNALEILRNQQASSTSSDSVAASDRSRKHSRPSPDWMKKRQTTEQRK
jgi:hypothetical protein